VTYRFEQAQHQRDHVLCLRRRFESRLLAAAPDNWEPGTRRQPDRDRWPTRQETVQYHDVYSVVGSRIREQKGIELVELVIGERSAQRHVHFLALRRRAAVRSAVALLNHDLPMSPPRSKASPPPFMSVHRPIVGLPPWCHPTLNPPRSCRRSRHLRASPRPERRRNRRRARRSASRVLQR
jgi:hypothetical protein